MSHYKANLRDIEFNLFEVLRRDELLGHPPFDEVDVDTARSILEEVERLATEDLAASFEDADRHPPTFDPETHSVTLPESFKRSFRTWMDAEWYRLDVPTEIGGTAAPSTLRWAVQELVLGANPAIHMYGAGPGFGGILYELATEDQRKVAARMVERKWGSTMVLTEPDAGSDVGAGRTRAIQQPDGTWHIEGVKRFITSGDQDMTENIIHLVLARPEGHGPGTKGLSLFIVPKFLFDWDTGELGERNGVFVTNVEKKMGLKVSATCEVTFGEQQPAVGYLVGERHQGIAQMFKVIESARMMVGTKAIATLSTGYLNALEYAKSRVQGADMTQMTDKAAPRVTITHHPDVRRSLMTQKAYAEGMRALVYYTASFQDRVLLAEADGRTDEDAERINDLLLPIVKGYGSERSYEQLAQSLQTLGGSGYLQDYPLEQYIRDAKIDTLYEGTTAIQAQDFFFRKIVRDQGRALTQLFGEIQEFAKSQAGGEDLAPERDLLLKALEDVQGIVNTMVGALESVVDDVHNVYKVGLNTTRLLMAGGDLVCGWLLLRHAAVAGDRLREDAEDLSDKTRLSEKEVAFYTGKVAAGKFFARTILPALAPQRAIAEAMDTTLMEVPEEAF